jgi:hypothetical protein
MGAFIYTAGKKKKNPEIIYKKNQKIANMF